MAEKKLNEAALLELAAKMAKGGRGLVAKPTHVIVPVKGAKRHGKSVS